mmetsp:Transcript_1798/g.6435  ORF Transcript_1798/g.6435 Transcript_1798/m.6435 type:complete len:212 (-) Transcript_1798:750-1385(-)
MRSLILQRSFPFHTTANSTSLLFAIYTQFKRPASLHSTANKRGSALVLLNLGFLRRKEHGRQRLPKRWKVASADKIGAKKKVFEQLRFRIRSVHEAPPAKKATAKVTSNTSRTAKDIVGTERAVANCRASKAKLLLSGKKCAGELSAACWSCTPKSSKCVWMYLNSASQVGRSVALNCTACGDNNPAPTNPTVSRPAARICGGFAAEDAPW